MSFIGGEYISMNVNIQLPEATVQEQLEEMLPSMTEQELLRVLAFAQGTVTRLALSEPSTKEEGKTDG